MYQRIIESKIKEKLFDGKIICLFGPRRSGKTTLVKKILSDFEEEGYYMNCEDTRERQYLLPGQPDILKKYLGSKKVVVLDEAQTIEHIGTVLKVFVDTYPEIQLIATGSSSFELANRVGEPLVGRSWDFFLPPLSFKEIFGDKGGYEIQKSFEDILVYGSFPSVVSSKPEEKIATLGQIANNYLYKDIFTYEQIRKPKILEDLLRLLALQIGNEVNTTELSRTLEIGRPTVERYLQLLEKTFVVKRLYSLKRNRRDEIRSAFKVYFYDNGVRNYLVNAFNQITLRNDVGALFENYFVMERIKYHQQTTCLLPPIYFWRTHSQLEIDYIEEGSGKFFAFECKWSDTKKATFTEFQKTYPHSETHVVNPQNIGDFL
jgi:predicted AAA+ superfamily ATPase